jgi:hypothetical protein
VLTDRVLRRSRVPDTVSASQFAPVQLPS